MQYISPSWEEQFKRTYSSGLSEQRPLHWAWIGGWNAVERFVETRGPSNYPIVPCRQDWSRTSANKVAELRRIRNKIRITRFIRITVPGTWILRGYREPWGSDRVPLACSRTSPASRPTDNRSSIYEHRPASTPPNICQESRIARHRDSFVSHGRCRSLRRNDPRSPTRCPRVARGHSATLLSDCGPETILLSVFGNLN